MPRTERIWRTESLTHFPNHRADNLYIFIIKNVRFHWLRGCNLSLTLLRSQAGSFEATGAHIPSIQNSNQFSGEIQSAITSSSISRESGSRVNLLTTGIQASSPRRIRRIWKLAFHDLRWRSPYKYMEDFYTKISNLEKVNLLVSAIEDRCSSNSFSAKCAEDHTRISNNRLPNLQRLPNYTRLLTTLKTAKHAATRRNHRTTFLVSLVSYSMKTRYRGMLSKTR